MDRVNFLNFNAYRSVDIQRMNRFLDIIKRFNASIITIQEIHIGNALKVFQNEFRVFVNVEQVSKDLIGLCTLVKNDIQVKDVILGGNGRVIGVLLDNLKVFNVYPKSGTQNRSLRETFFRQELPHLLKFWDNDQMDLILCGDFNCIHRKQDSINNPDAHFQPALVKFMKIYGLSDDFLSVNGEVKDVYSRVTLRSKTRIDMILSNSNKCSKFEYISFPFLDHKMILAEYSILLSSRFRKVPKDRFISGWVIGRELEHDDVFIDVVHEVLKQIELEVGLSPDFSPSYVWFKFKETLTVWAKSRSKYLKKMESYEYQRLLQFYDMAIEDLSKGVNCREEIQLIIRDLNQFYNKKVKQRIEDAKYLEIKDNVYDLLKKQKEKKFQNSGSLDKIKIDDMTYEGNTEIVDAIELKMRKELSAFVPSKNGVDKEKYFLDFLPKLDLLPSEVVELEKVISEDEVENILESKKIDLDSSPGYDGITYRFLKLFWNHSFFRKIFLGFLNEIKDTGDFGPIENWGVMVLKNKKTSSIEYSKKRKLTKCNKDVNLLGKIWTNRCKLFILDKVVPKSQYVCRSDQTIADELRILRDINLYLLNGNESGSILSVDYADAFRSVSLSFFAKVMDVIGFPKSFSSWFWHMVQNIGIVISVNRCKSSVIWNRRGFMEGFPPSMACWVLSSIAIILALQSKLQGIQLPDGRVFKDSNFADDGKLFLKFPQEVHTVDKLVSEFEEVSGVKLHRNKMVRKCNVLSFGKHQDYDKWPDWVNKVNSLKVIGGTFVNQGSLEKTNSEIVKNKVIGKINENWGIGGTLFQKAFFCNTFCFSKLNYLGQAFKLEKKALDAIRTRALAFIYAGYNERPVQVLNFRKQENGGLSLHHPGLKAESLLLKSMHRECVERDIGVFGGKLSSSVYGYEDLYVEVRAADVGTSSKEIYKFLLRKLVRVNSSLVPTRIERKIQGVRWSRSFSNARNIRVSPVEREFIFLLSQDLLPVNGRLHRRNSDHRCLREMEDGSKCEDIQTRIHYFITCPVIAKTFVFIKNILKDFIGKNLNPMQILHVSFSVLNKKLTAAAIWFVVKVLFKMFKDKAIDHRTILNEIVVEMRLYWKYRIKKYDNVYFNGLEELIKDRLS